MPYCMPPLRLYNLADITIQSLEPSIHEYSDRHVAHKAHVQYRHNTECALWVNSEQYPVPPTTHLFQSQKFRSAHEIAPWALDLLKDK